MSIDLQTAVNVLVGLLGLGLGWLTKALADLRRADSELVIEVHQLALIVAGIQQQNADTLQFRNEVRDQLRYIVERIDKGAEA